MRILIGKGEGDDETAKKSIAQIKAKELHHDSTSSAKSSMKNARTFNIKAADRRGCKTGD